MTQNPTDWSQDEFKAYLLLHCSAKGSSITWREKRRAKSKLDNKSFRKIYKEFKKDSDSDSMPKIREWLEKHKFSAQQSDSLISEAMAQFISDGSYSQQEKTLLAKLKSLLR